MSLVPQMISVSATPGEFELQLSGGAVVEQIIRPTGLIDPEVDIRPVRGQVDDLLAEIRLREALAERVLVTTLTKRMSEDLTDYLQQAGVRVRYLHSDIDAIERMEILRGLRLGDFDVLVGINLLREGLDLPEVSLVAILDADQEGFLRSDRSLVQTIGRAARNINGRAILYADRITGSMQRALEEMDRRREIQRRHNEEHGITPRSIVKSMDEVRLSTHVADARTEKPEPRGALQDRVDLHDPARRAAAIQALERQMREAAANLEFEMAALLRDQLNELRAASAPDVRRGGVGPADAPARVIRSLDEKELAAEGVALGRALPAGTRRHVRGRSRRREDHTSSRPSHAGSASPGRPPAPPTRSCTGTTGGAGRSSISIAIGSGPTMRPPISIGRACWRRATRSSSNGPSGRARGCRAPARRFRLHHLDDPTSRPGDALMLLALETATDRASVAVGRTEADAVEENVTGARRHAASLLPMIDSALRRAGASRSTT